MLKSVEVVGNDVTHGKDFEDYKVIVCLRARFCYIIQYVRDGIVSSELVYLPSGILNRANQKNGLVTKKTSASKVIYMFK